MSARVFSGPSFKIIQIRPTSGKSAKRVNPFKVSCEAMYPAIAGGVHPDLKVKKSEEEVRRLVELIDDIRRIQRDQFDDAAARLYSHPHDLIMEGNKGNDAVRHFGDAVVGDFYFNPLDHLVAGGIFRSAIKSDDDGPRTGGFQRSGNKRRVGCGDVGEDYRRAAQFNPIPTVGDNFIGVNKQVPAVQGNGISLDNSDISVYERDGAGRGGYIDTDWR